MIISFLLESAYLLFGWVLDLLPESTGLPEGVESAFDTVFSAMNSISYIFPVDTAFTVVGIVIGYELIIWSFFAFMWVWKRIPFLGK